MKKEKKKTESTEPVEKAKLTGKQKAIRILKIVLNTIINILIVFVLVTSIVIAIVSVSSKNDPDGLPNIFGYTFQYVQTNSMDTTPPDGYEGGNFSDQDVLIGKKYTESEFSELEVGDIITYRSDEKDDDGNKKMITHRIVDVQERDGETIYQTKGDAVQVPDQTVVENYLRSGKIVAVNYTDKYHGKVLKGFANVFRSIRSQKGFFLFILLPMILFFLYALFRVVWNFASYRKEKELENKEVAEKEKQEAIAAAIAEKEASAAPSDMTPEQMEQFKQFLAFQKAQNASPAETADDDSVTVFADPPVVTPAEEPAAEPAEDSPATEED